MLDAHVQPRGEAVERALERRVVERDQAPAGAAEQMVMVAAAGIDALEARLAIPDRQALDQAELDEQIEGAIDGRAANWPTTRSQGVFDLERGESAGLPVEQVDDL